MINHDRVMYTLTFLAKDLDHIHPDRVSYFTTKDFSANTLQDHTEEMPEKPRQNIYKSRRDQKSRRNNFWASIWQLMQILPH